MRSLKRDNSGLIVAAGTAPDKMFSRRGNIQRRNEPPCHPNQTWRAVAKIEDHPRLSSGNLSIDLHSVNHPRAARGMNQPEINQMRFSGTKLWCFSNSISLREGLKEHKGGGLLCAVGGGDCRAATDDTNYKSYSRRNTRGRRGHDDIERTIDSGTRDTNHIPLPPNRIPG
ncbi:predicted protein [Histoplasma capsulatum G186AR]|uniref:Uncharacterized protein n=1 Tax=Ajellomyces capsulatus (strain G186AR / H82 / ATCC MYA-2454 / RMSCC 2432) TaxID=447093 RepID=C0NTI0_AJECG|nr:uncharacterized protein HCBG_06460 [Histoplasma capsulatum G186AR]EEH05341.1 predicted protein [Histoplasma capsulatum G186AR]